MKWLLTGAVVLALGLAWVLHRKLAGKRCRYCDGRKEVPFHTGGTVIWVDCPHCHGAED